MKNTPMERIMTEKDLHVNMSRDFKGIWIPREIWLAEGLSATDKILWAEIDSLYHEGKKGCFASNEYLACFMGVKERTIRDALCKLRQLQLIEDVSFDGRERVIKALPVGPDFSSRLSEWRKSAMQSGGNPPVTPAENRQPHIYIEQSLVTSLDSPPIPPQKETADAGAAKAAEEILKDSSKPKRTRTPSEFSPKVKELAEKMVNALHQANHHWLIPKNLHPMMTQIEDMIAKEKRNPKDILDVFMWAISDHFWMDKLCKPNPAKYLREQFGQLAGKMLAKPAPKERKFAPSSNDAHSLEKMLEWEKGAL